MSYARFNRIPVNAYGGLNAKPQQVDFDGVPITTTGALANGNAKGLAIAVGGTLGTVTGTCFDGSTFSIVIASNQPILLDVASITSLGAATSLYALY